MKTWREAAEFVILRVAKENPNLSEKELRKKFSEAYPFHERAYHPYKIWLSAIKLYFKPKPQRDTNKKTIVVNENQISMF